MSGVTLTQHAIERMQQWGITREEIVLTLCFGEPSPGHQPRTYKSRFPVNRLADFAPPPGCANNVVVVYQKRGAKDEHRVITAYRDTSKFPLTRCCR